IAPGLFGIFPSQMAPQPFVVAGDFRNVGILDVVATSTNGIFHYASDGMGGFLSDMSMTTLAGAGALATGDLNRDGKLDVAVIASSHIGLFPGNGAGAFTAPTSVSVGTTPSSVAIADFNRDGKLDVAVANTGSGTVSISLQASDGSWPANAGPLNVM